MFILEKVIVEGVLFELVDEFETLEEAKQDAYYLYPGENLRIREE